MIRSGEAGTSEAQALWRAALRLDREAGIVSGPVADPSRARPPLLFFTDPNRTPEPWITAARLPRGAGVVYRTFGAPDAEAVARRLRQATADRGVRLLIGLDAGLAARVGADGVHLPERALDQAEGLRADWPHWLLTGALHDPSASGEGFGALDAVVLSPIFPAGGASAARPALGVGALATAARAAGRPVYALGGITPATLADLKGSAACGFAAVDAIIQAFGSVHSTPEPPLEFEQ